MRKNKEKKQTAKLLRGMRAKWISFNGTSWTLIGKNMESLSTNLNPDTETGKDVTGATYVEHKGYSPESDIEYQARDDDSIYTNLQAIVDNLYHDETHCGGFMIEATLNDEVKNAQGKTTVTGTGYKVPVMIVPQEDGGDTSGYTITFNVYENGARTQGSVSVSDGAPTFTATT